MAVWITILYRDKTKDKEAKKRPGVRERRMIRDIATKRKVENFGDAV